MKIHLFRSDEISVMRFSRIHEIIKKHAGPIDFIFRDEDLLEEDILDEPEDRDRQDLQALAWSTLFARCEDFREQNSEIKEEDIVVYFTDHGNYDEISGTGNWFSSWDPYGKKNFFIQTSGWENYVESEECYPITYELVTIPLYLSVCNDLDEVKEMAHYDSPRGCPFDYCEEKSEVPVRLRTGDVCPECRDKMSEKGLDAGIASQIFSILDDIRQQMLFRRQFQLTKQLSRIELNLSEKKIIFTDLGSTSVRLRPREMAVYWLYLKNPEGIRYPYLIDMKDELRHLLRQISSDANLPRFNTTLDNLVNGEDGKYPALEQAVSNIKRKIKACIGEEMADHYTINQTNDDNHLIPLGRTLVKMPNIQ